jgi:hypothetical protein
MPVIITRIPRQTDSFSVSAEPSSLETFNPISHFPGVFPKRWMSHASTANHGRNMEINSQRFPIAEPMSRPPRYIPSHHKAE